MRKFIALMLPLAAIFSLQAQNQAAVSLDSCRNMALRSNKAIAIADQGVEGAGYARKAAHAAYLPGIDFAATYMYNQHKINLLGSDAKLPTMNFDASTGSYKYNILTNPETGAPILNPANGEPIPAQVAVIPKEAMSYDIHNVVAGAITLTQPVYMGGAIRAMNDITKYAEQMAQSMRNQAVQDVVYAVDEAYWTVVSVAQKRKLAQSYANLLDSLYSNVQDMYTEGVATRSDVLSVEVKRNQAQLLLTKAENGESLARMALAQVCGLPIDSNMKVADENLSDIYNGTAEPTADMNSVYARRQDLAILRSGIKMAESQEKLARSAMMPKLAIVAAWGFSNPNVIDGFEKRFGGGFSVGAMLQVPIWHWGGNLNKVKAAKAAALAQKLRLDDAESLVDLQVSQARFRYNEALKTLEMTRTNLASADENLRNAQYGFKEGVLTSDDVTTAQTAWVQAHTEEIDAAVALRLCRVYLSKVLGLL